MHYSLLTIGLILPFVISHVEASSSGWERIPFLFFYPPGTVEVSNKSKKCLPIGTLQLSESPVGRKREVIESIPVQTRLETIDKMISSTFKGQRKFFDAPHRDPVRLAYTEHLQKLTSIDPGVYRLLVRYATSMLDPISEVDLVSASAIFEHIQTQFPNGELNYVTPEYLLDWYTFIGGSVGRLHCARDTRIREIIERNVPIIYGDPRIIVKLNNDGIREMLKIRRNRLLTTGYEILP